MTTLYSLHQIPRLDQIAPAAKSAQDANNELKRRKKQVLCGACGQKTSVSWEKFQVMQQSAVDGEYYGCQFAFQCRHGCGLVLAELPHETALSIVALMNALPLSVPK